MVWVRNSQSRGKFTKIHPGLWVLISPGSLTSHLREWIFSTGKILCSWVKKLMISTRTLSLFSSTRSLMDIHCSITSQPMLMLSKWFITSSRMLMRTTCWPGKTKTCHSLFFIQMTMEILHLRLLSKSKDLSASSWWSICWRTTKNSSSLRWC